MCQSRTGSRLLFDSGARKFFCSQSGLLRYPQIASSRNEYEHFSKTMEPDVSTSQGIFRVVRKLEKLNLLEVLPRNQVRMKVVGNIRFQHQGSLARVILRPQILQFLDHVDVVLKNKDVCMHSAEVELSKTHISQLVEEIHALGAKYRARALRDKNLLSSDKLQSVRWLYAFAPYQTNWQQYKINL